MVEVENLVSNEFLIEIESRTRSVSAAWYLNVTAAFDVSRHLYRTVAIFIGSFA